MEWEETSMFPGDSAALKGKAVKIFTVQPVSGNPKESGGAVRLKAFWTQSYLDSVEAFWGTGHP